MWVMENTSKNFTLVLEEKRTSNWASPGLLMEKPGKSLMFCTDFCKVNAVTKPDYCLTSKNVLLKLVQLNK